MADELAQAVKRSIEREWNLVGSQDRAGDTLTTLRSRYEVVASEIHPYHHPEYGTETYKGEPGANESSRNASESRFPARRQRGARPATGPRKGSRRGYVLANAEKYENLALSVPWLKEYMQAHPRVSGPYIVRPRAVRSATRPCEASRTTCVPRTPGSHSASACTTRTDCPLDRGQHLLGVLLDSLPGQAHAALALRWPVRTAEMGSFGFFGRGVRGVQNELRWVFGSRDNTGRRLAPERAPRDQ